MWKKMETPTTTVGPCLPMRRIRKAVRIMLVVLIIVLLLVIGIRMTHTATVHSVVVMIMLMIVAFVIVIIVIGFPMNDTIMILGMIVVMIAVHRS